MRFRCATYAVIVCCTSAWFTGSEVFAAMKESGFLSRQGVDRDMPAGSSDATFLLAKVDGLQRELQQLRGQLEVQGNELKMLKQQQQSSYAELDKRIAVITADIKPDDIINNFAGGMNANSSGSPEEITQAAPAASVTQGQVVGKQEFADEETSYQQAYALIRNQEFDRAITAMQRFLQYYPDSSYAANAFYWLGELYLAQGNPDQAINEFNTVLKRYGNSNKVAPAMLKLGFAYHEKGQLNQARAQLQQVKTQFPDSNIAYLAASRLEMIAREGSA